MITKKLVFIITRDFKVVLFISSSFLYPLPHGGEQMPQFRNLPSLTWSASVKLPNDVATSIFTSLHGLVIVN